MAGDVGREIAGFRIESEIGRGGMGVVYLAHQSFPERKVALKLLSPELASDPAFRERFVHESNAAASTEHPNIVPVYGAGEADGQLYLAMRYVEGTDLASLLSREGALSPERAAQICAEVAEALEAAHERGLIHRDVKPGNILLDTRDRAYLTDFGLIRRTQLHTGVTKTGQFMGTIDYCAPEQIKGGEIDGRADVYSLGCVLFECLTGAPPFRKDTEVATIYAHMEEDAPKASSRRSGISPVLSGVVTKAMAKRPQDRFATAGEMAETLRGGLGAARRPARRGRLRYLVTGVALLVAIVGAVVLSTRNDDGEPSATGPTGAAFPRGSLVQLDAESGEVTSSTEGVASERGNLPSVDLGEGSVWVASAGTLSWIDESDGRIVDRITLGTSFGINTLTTAERVVWVSGAEGVERVSATDGTVLRPVDIGRGEVVVEFYLAGGSGAVWAVTGGGQVSRIDPQTARITDEVDAAQSATDIAAGFDAVWVADDLGGTITRVDAGTLGIDVPIEVPGGIDDVEAGAGAVWVLDSDAGVVTPIDPDTGGLGSPIRVGAVPTDIAAGLDALWVANHGDGTISKVDPITGSTVATFDVGASVATVAVDESARRLWVTIATTLTG